VASNGIGITFEDPQPIDEHERDFLRLVARYSAQAVERLRLVSAERASRERSDATAERMRLLSEASRAFSEAGADVSRVRDAVAMNLIGGLADSATVLLLSEPTGTLEVASAHHRDPAKTEARPILSRLKFGCSSHPARFARFLGFFSGAGGLSGITLAST
jgi:hypothetical protein